MRVLITGARAPAALHLARLLHGAGYHVVMADSLRHTVGAASNACAHFVLLPAANGDAAAYGRAIHTAVADHRIELVIPTCEEVFHLAHLWTQDAPGIPLFAPDLSVLLAAHNKYRFIQTVKALGLVAPETVLLSSQADLDAVRDRAADLVFKPVWSRFATDVLIRPKRLKITPTSARPWVAQEFIGGEEICVYALAHQGRVMAQAAYRPIYRAGRGAGIAFAPITDPAVDHFVTRFAQGTGWTGQVSFDLMRRPDGAVLPLECNPRATSGIHFFRHPKGFVDALNGSSPARPDVATPQAVRAALLLYGPAQHPMEIWRDLWHMGDALAWPGDPAPAWQQIPATLEVAAIALRHRISLTKAATRDISFDG